MARPRIIADCATLSRYIDEFIDLCEGNGSHPSNYALCQYLNISIDTLERYTREPDKYKGYAEPLKKLSAYREDRLLRLLEKNPGKATPYIFLLKQPSNGGYQDVQKADNSGGLEVNIRLVGEDGKPVGKVGGA